MRLNRMCKACSSHLRIYFCFAVCFLCFSLESVAGQTIQHMKSADKKIKPSPVGKIFLCVCSTVCPTTHKFI